jgi:pimeloyl-ACP methyl ester carboxylesterase
MTSIIERAEIHLPDQRVPCLATGRSVDGIPDVLLLHGLGGSARQWEEVMRRLPDDRRWLAVDLPGHGANPWPAVCPLDTVVDWVSRTARAATSGSRIGVVGHSLGGLLALRLAIARPELVAWLGLVATAARVSLHPEMREQLESGTSRPEFITGCFAREVPAARLAELVEDFGRLRLGVPVANVWGTHGIDLRAAARSVAAPALVIAAGADVVISPRKSRELSQLLPAATLVEMEACGHYAHLEDPDRVAGELVHLGSH